MSIANWIAPFQAADGPPPKTLVAFARWALKGSFLPIAAGSAVSVVSGLIEVASALMLGMVIDAALAGSAEGFFAENTGLILGVSVFFLLFRPAWLALSGVMQSVVLGPSISALILSRLHRYTLGQAVSFFDNDFAGRISQKQMQASRALTDIVVEFVHTVVFAFASVVGSLILVMTLDWRAGFALALWFIAYVFFLRFFMPRIRKASRARAAANATVSGQIVDTIGNIKTVKLFAHDDHEDKAAINAMKAFRQKGIAWGWVSASFRGSLMVLSGVLPLILVGVTLLVWSRGGASTGDIAVAGTIGLRLAQMTGWVSFTLMGMYGNVGVLEDAVQTLTPEHTLGDAPNAGVLDVPKGTITLDDVTFSYGGGPGGLNAVDLNIASGERLGIVGASGAGKSTLVALLLRLYDTEKGRVLIDGQDISQVTQESLRRQIAMVTQETAMFNRSARDNIGYGSPDATEDQIIAAAQQAEAHDFLIDLKDFMDRTGYDAHLGERGVKLSGGQRQRIAIARAILKDAPILVLDEATSALDSEVEASIQSALETVMEGKTVIAIAHRLSTLARMDRIIVLDAGRIVEQGSHDDLLAQDGLYARYWNRQSGGFINVKDAAE
ncbi:ABC transporter ATP-binding protein/permease [Loktanella sp. F6476L]|uniref:ABC transporter ATP-binding protein n=1 Tax=Loktanella sp. F6476L TaxID=2926405 RepID=UPI001FF54B24|nr:ABC transporter ATP-binding protein [Loktanella sp. F6476L]MCK0122070.1 ABC transporter ATP-binding protein/permease [Loktanella sp. F6476L]